MSTSIGRTLLAAGSNAKGQLGIGSCDDAHTFQPCKFAGSEPNRLPDLSTIVHIACGANHTVLLLARPDGQITLWGTGDGRRGQLGPGHSRDRPESESAPWSIFRPLLVPLSATYVSRGYTYTQVTAAWETTYVVLSHPEDSDVLLSMGSNDFGALGAGEDGASDRTPSVRGVVDFGHVFPDDGPQTRRIRVRSLHAGPRHVVAQLVLASVDAPSRTVLVGWGACRHGQLGRHGQTRLVARPTVLPIDIHEDPMVSCALGNQHTVVLHASGRVSALGSNKQGQMPSLGSQERVYGLGCTWNGTYMQTGSGVLLSTGNNAQGQLGRRTLAGSVEQTVKFSGKRVVTGFICGSEHVLVTTTGSSQEDETVLGWGWNEHGNMGLDSLANVPVPTQLWPNEEVGTNHEYPQRVIGIWAGCATSWLLVE